MKSTNETFRDRFSHVRSGRQREHRHERVRGLAGNHTHTNVDGSATPRHAHDRQRDSRESSTQRVLFRRGARSAAHRRSIRGVSASSPGRGHCHGVRVVSVEEARRGRRASDE